MATFCPSSGTIKFSQIRSAFGLSTVSLKARRSTAYWRSDAYKGTFPSGSISIKNFYSTGSTSPVTPSSVYYSASNGTVEGATNTKSYVVPVYYQMQIDCRAGGGGGGGGGGATYAFNGALTSTGNGGSGTSGGSTSFGAYSSASGGGGGGPYANGANGAGADGLAYGGAGGASGYIGVASGGAGGVGGFSTKKVLSPVNGGTGPAPGSTITITVGKGGAGGSGYGTGAAGSPGRFGEFAVYIT